MCVIEMKRVKLADLMPLGAPVSKAKVKRYEKMMREGANFPPCVVVKSGGQFQMLDGNHRGLAAMRDGQKYISAAVFHPESGAEEDLIGELSYALSDAGVPWPVALKVMRTMLGIHFIKSPA